MKTQHDILMEDPEFRKLLAIEGLVAEASETIARLMDERGMSKADLARSLGKSRAWVTQLLSGSANMTVRTLAEVIHALGAEVKLQAQAPAWKAAAVKAQNTGWQPVVFKMDRSWPGTASSATTIFRLEDETLRTAQDDEAPVTPCGEPGRTEYAA